MHVQRWYCLLAAVCAMSGCASSPNDKSIVLAEQGSFFVSGGGGGPSRSNELACTTAQIDAALATIEHRISRLDDSNYIYGLESIAIHKKTNAAQKARAVADLKKVVETKGASQRTFALRKLVDIDPKNKAYAAKQASDPDLKWTVESIMKAK